MALATLQNTVIGVLEGDATLAGLLTGGVYDATDFDRDGWTLQDVQRTPSGRVMPFAALRWGQDRPGGGLTCSARQSLEIYFYADAGFETIRQAKRQAIKLLHQQAFTTTFESIARAVWVGGQGETVADELGNLPMLSARFDFTYAWRE